jgi:hypothetical protein
MSMPQPTDLSDEMLDMIHRAAGPLPASDRRLFYNTVATWLDQTVLPTPRTLADAIVHIQGQLLRPAVKA